MSEVTWLIHLHNTYTTPWINTITQRLGRSTDWFPVWLGGSHCTHVGEGRGRNSIYKANDISPYPRIHHFTHHSWVSIPTYTPSHLLWHRAESLQNHRINHHVRHSDLGGRLRRGSVWLGGSHNTCRWLNIYWKKYPDMLTVWKPRDRLTTTNYFYQHHAVITTLRWKHWSVLTFCHAQINQLIFTLYWDYCPKQPLLIMHLNILSNTCTILITK